MTTFHDADTQNGDHSLFRRPGAGLLIICILSGGLLAGCVSSEKYEAEKARALNFQRLLAQEEKRTGELNTQVQETKRQVASLESHNKDLTIELDALREQMTRKETKMPAESAPSDFSSSSDLSLSEPSLSEFGLSDLSFDESDFKDFGDMGGSGGSSGGGEPNYYTVRKGDTLYGISRDHGVTVSQLKDWNHLMGNTISIGQRLVVSQP